MPQQETALEIAPKMRHEPMRSGPVISFAATGRKCRTKTARKRAKAGA
jgi:hypothetical protein